MELLNIVQEILLSKIDLAIILLVISVGELVKRYWKGAKTNSFFKVIIPTLPLTILYAYLGVINPEITLLSYLVAFWLYPLLVKPTLIFLGLKKRKQYSRRDIGGEIPNTDDED